MGMEARGFAEGARRELLTSEETKRAVKLTARESEIARLAQERQNPRSAPDCSS